MSSHASNEWMNNTHHFVVICDKYWLTMLYFRIILKPADESINISDKKHLCDSAVHCSPRHSYSIVLDGETA
jgi:hypothetical protein